MKLKKIELALILGLTAAIFFNIFSFAFSSRNIKKDVLRLHIIANSDSAFDQALKLKVRNEILRGGNNIFSGNETLEQAKSKIAANLDNIRNIAVQTIEKNGCKYSVKVALEKAFFDTRYYNNFTLPAGEYEALKVVIGKGEGHNWWCVMFPPLCLSASDNINNVKSLTEEEKRLILSNPDYEIRFKCVEIYEKLKNYLKNS